MAFVFVNLVVDLSAALLDGIHHLLRFRLGAARIVSAREQQQRRFDQIKAPLLLLAGGHDPRCPKSETQQVVDAIKKRGGKVDYKIYENEGHGFARVENQIDAYKRVADFLLAHVPPADCSCSLSE